MNIFKIAVGKFVSSFGVLRVPGVDPKMPLCILIESMLPNEFILCLCWRPVFGPGALSVDHDVSFADEFFGVGESDSV
jgi:hypothetical protein